MTHAALKQDWKKVQEVLAKQVGDENYRMFLKNTLVIQLNSRLAEIGVPNLIVADFLEEKFSSTILRSIKTELGFQPQKIKFSVNGHLFRKLRENQQQKAGVSTGSSDQEEAPSQKKKHSPSKSLSTPPARRTPYSSQVFHINERFHLGNFIVGSNNKLAFNCAVEVARKPGKTYNPLFIFGGCGQGKTHLLQGVAHELNTQHKDLAMLYVSAEYFVNQYIIALREKKLQNFRKTFRSLDVLIVDDIDFFASKQKSQEEFLHTLKAIEARNGQVLLATTTHPKELQNIQQGLLSRFVQGMVVELKTPSYQMRLSLIKSKLGSVRKQFQESTITFLASKLECSIRELEGYLTQLVALASMSEDTITLPFVQAALKDFLCGAKRRVVELSDIENEIVGYFGVSSKALRGRSRERKIARARQVCMYLARELTHHSLKEIGAFFGNKNHTTVIFASQRITKEIDSNTSLQATLEHLKNRLTQRTS